MKSAGVIDLAPMYANSRRCGNPCKAKAKGKVHSTMTKAKGVTHMHATGCNLHFHISDLQKKWAVCRRRRRRSRMYVLCFSIAVLSGNISSQNIVPEMCHPDTFNPETPATFYPDKAHPETYQYSIQK